MTCETPAKYEKIVENKASVAVLPTPTDSTPDWRDSAMRIIPLTRDYFTFVDDADYEWLSQYRWCLNGRYAVRYEGKTHSRVSYYMHREILKCPEGKEGDHINRNTLDNRRENLRIATRLQNAVNRGANRTRNGAQVSSLYKGVSYIKSGQCYRSAIVVSGFQLNLGSYGDEKTAALAYDEAARIVYGEYAVLNFPAQRAQILDERRVSILRGESPLPTKGVSK